MTESAVNLAIFDLDNTLLAGDSDHAWGVFLAEKGVVDADSYQRANQRYYEQYLSGELDIREFLAFALKPLADNSLTDLLRWRDEFMRDCIEPIILSKAEALIQQHRDQQDILLIITATNRFVTEPIAQRLGVPHLLATEPTMDEHGYTGAVSGVPCFQTGKVTRFNAWCQQQGLTVNRSWFYSDSHNDIPLLSLVTDPVVVDADAKLQHHAKEYGWPQISLR